ncbi:hypothetical protein ACFVH4_19155 [Nocardia ignorata]|uniref:hypothetical protein n=1 Tax=Nocardia ignorata TaxID=145285 RepID=UPI0036284073
MTQPPYPPHQVPPPQRPPNRSTRTAWIIGGAVVAVIIVLAIVGNLIKDDEAAAPTAYDGWPTLPASTATAKASTTTPTTTAPSFQRTATATPSPDFPAGLDARCSAAPQDLVDKIAAGLKDPNHRVAHAVLLTGPTGIPHIGASIVAADGLLIEKSDVWVNTKSRGMTAATGGARRHSDLPKTTDVLEFDLGSDEVQTVDMCAWKWAKASGYN